VGYVLVWELRIRNVDQRRGASQGHPGTDPEGAAVPDVVLRQPEGIRLAWREWETGCRDSAYRIHRRRRGYSTDKLATSSAPHPRFRGRDPSHCWWAGNASRLTRNYPAEKTRRKHTSPEKARPALARHPGSPIQTRRSQNAAAVELLPGRGSTSPRQLVLRERVRPADLPEQEPICDQQRS
jgi:hypothetical protein